MVNAIHCNYGQLMQYTKVTQETHKHSKQENKAVEDPRKRENIHARVADVGGTPERSGSSRKERTSNIRYFVAKVSIVAICVLFEGL